MIKIKVDASRGEGEQLDVKLSKFVKYLTLTVTIDSHSLRRKIQQRRRQGRRTPIDTPSAGDAKMVRDTTGEVETETKTKARNPKMRPFEKKKLATLKR
jgi:hypothetical protein